MVPHLVISLGSSGVFTQWRYYTYPGQAKVYTESCSVLSTFWENTHVCLFDTSTRRNRSVVVNGHVLWHRRDRNHSDTGD
jgi:hypothetical protein